MPKFRVKAFFFIEAHDPGGAEDIVEEVLRSAAGKDYDTKVVVRRNCSKLVKEKENARKSNAS